MAVRCSLRACFAAFASSLAVYLEPRKPNPPDTLLARMGGSCCIGPPFSRRWVAEGLTFPQNGPSCDSL
ncbi:hypothetical protein Plhal304r1_c019g0066141 [Plasmopara halstedii]